MVSERFRRALNDFKEVNSRGGLSQDTTIKDMYDTQSVLIIKLFKIGREEGMSDKDIQTLLFDELHAFEKRTDSTLFDYLGMIFGGINADNKGQVDYRKLEADFPHEKIVAKGMYLDVGTKFMACSEQERRQITRSDAEFMYLAGLTLARRCGFKDMYEAFDIDETTLVKNIPKIERGNELLWHEIGDPEPEVTPEDKIMYNKMYKVVSMILTNLKNLYPDLYEQLKEQLNGTITINTSNKEARNILDKLANVQNMKEFVSIAVPMLVDGLVIQFLTKKESYMNNHKRQSIRKTLINAVLNDDYERYNDIAYDYKV